MSGPNGNTGLPYSGVTRRYRRDPAVIDDLLEALSQLLNQAPAQVDEAPSEQG